MEGGNAPHTHHQGCGCAEEAKRTDPHGYDLFPHIDLPQVECFNQRATRSIHNILRPLSERMDFSAGVVESSYGTNLVMFIPFNGEVKIKSLIVIGGDEGQAPSRVKIWKNETTVDFNILEDKKPLHVIDLNENLSGDLDYLLNVSKFSNIGNIVLGFEDNFGAASTVVKYVGFKGEKLRQK